MIRFILLAAMAAFFVGCATNRDEPGAYEKVSAGAISVSNLSRFRDCVSDSFKDRTAGLGVMFMNRWQRRHEGYRIELVGNETGPLLSADIFDDGRYELYETTRFVRIRVQDERERFAQCVDRFK